MNEMKTQQPLKNASNAPALYKVLGLPKDSYAKSLEEPVADDHQTHVRLAIEEEIARWAELDVILPEPPAGHRWEYRGVGWDNDKKPTLYAHCCRNYPDPYFGRYQLVPEGDSDTHYWEAVVDEPQYRRLEAGETIQEGDEYYDLNGDWRKTSGAGYRVSSFLPYRRPVDPNSVAQLLTDQQKLQIAIDALEKARGWKVADEALKQILE